MAATDQARDRSQGGRGAVLALVVLALACPSSAGLVRAEDAGARDFLFSEGQASRPAPATRPAPVASAAPPVALPAHVAQARPRPASTPAASRPAPKAAYASLPRAEAREARLKAPAEAGVAVKPARPAADAVAALLTDPTLRPGDIAVFPDGPKVFKGGQAPHRRGDFEDLRRSKAASAETRKAVLALGASPAARPVTQIQTPPALDVAAASPGAGPRVVYPGR